MLKSGRKKEAVDNTTENDSDNDIFSGPTSETESIDLPLRCTTRSLHLVDMKLRLEALAGAMKIPFASHLNGFENFVKKCISKVHKHRVCVLCKLGSIKNKEGAHQSKSSEDDATWKAWPEKNQAKGGKSDSLIENGTGKVVSPPTMVNINKVPGMVDQTRITSKEETSMHGNSCQNVLLQWELTAKTGCKESARSQEG